MVHACNGSSQELRQGDEEFSTILGYVRWHLKGKTSAKQSLSSVESAGSISVALESGARNMRAEMSTDDVKAAQKEGTV